MMATVRGLYVVLVLIVCLFFYGLWIKNVHLVKRPHGIDLPESARNVQTVGDWRSYPFDKGASTSFTMKSNWLSA